MEQFSFVYNRDAFIFSFKMQPKAIWKIAFQLVNSSFHIHYYDMINFNYKSSLEYQMKYFILQLLIVTQNNFLKQQMFNSEKQFHFKEVSTQTETQIFNNEITDKLRVILAQLTKQQMHFQQIINQKDEQINRWKQLVDRIQSQIIELQNKYTHLSTLKSKVNQVDQVKNINCSISKQLLKHNIPHKSQQNRIYQSVKFKSNRIKNRISTERKTNDHSKQSINYKNSSFNLSARQKKAYYSINVQSRSRKEIISSQQTAQVSKKYTFDHINKDINKKPLYQKIIMRGYLEQFIYKYYAEGKMSYRSKVKPKDIY